MQYKNLFLVVACLWMMSMDFFVTIFTIDLLKKSLDILSRWHIRFKDMYRTYQDNPLTCFFCCCYLIQKKQTNCQCDLPGRIQLTSLHMFSSVYTEIHRCRITCLHWYYIETLNQYSGINFIFYFWMFQCNSNQVQIIHKLLNIHFVS